MRIFFIALILCIGLSSFAQHKEGRDVVSTKKQSSNIEKVDENHQGYRHVPSVKMDNMSSNAEKRKDQNAEDYIDFPRYVNTGNNQQDKETYYTAKQVWIDQHPGLFEKISKNKKHEYNPNSKN